MAEFLVGHLGDTAILTIPANRRIPVQGQDVYQFDLKVHVDIGDDPGLQVGARFLPSGDTHEATLAGRGRNQLVLAGRPLVLLGAGQFPFICQGVTGVGFGPYLHSLGAGPMYRAAVRGVEQ